MSGSRTWMRTILVTVAACALAGGALAEAQGSPHPAAVAATAKAVKGKRGPRGPRGPQGPVGDSGPAGPQGPKGDAGAIGAPGPAGGAGPQGPRGDTGSQGAPGPAGGPGVSGYTVATYHITLGGNKGATMTAACPGGESALGGGASNDATNAIDLYQSYPSGGATGGTSGVASTPPAGSTAWTAFMVNNSSDNHGATVYAVCARIG